MFNHMNGGAFSAGAGAGLVGLMSQYPALNKFIMNNIEVKTVEKIKKYHNRGQCIQKMAMTNVFTNFFKLIKVPDPLNTPVISAVLARETLMMNVSSVGVAVPKYPRMMWHAREDEVIPFQDQLIFLNQQCSHGANIQFQVIHLANHEIAEIEGIPGVIKFLGQVFNHTTPIVKCGTGPGVISGLLDSAKHDLFGNGTMSSLLKRKEMLKYHSRKRIITTRMIH